MKRTRRKSERRYLLEVLVFFILGLILGHFAGKERDAARLRGPRRRAGGEPHAAPLRASRPASRALIAERG